MTHYDPRDWGQGDPEPPRMDWGDVVLAAMFVLIAAALLSQCSEADAATIPPFEVTLPTGQTLVACGIEYDARAKTLALAPCVIVFSDSFEG